MHRNMWRKGYIALVLCMLVAACEQFRDEKAEYNVYYYPNKGDARFLGKVVGLKKCRQVAQGFFSVNKNLKQNGTYGCCLIEDGNECAERLK